MLLEAVSCLASFAVSDSWESCNPVVYSRSPGMQQTYPAQLSSKNWIILNNVGIWLLSKEINKKPLQSCEGGSIFLTYRMMWLFSIMAFHLCFKRFVIEWSSKANSHPKFIYMSGFWKKHSGDINVRKRFIHPQLYWIWKHLQKPQDSPLRWWCSLTCKKLSSQGR